VESHFRKQLLRLLLFIACCTAGNIWAKSVRIDSSPEGQKSFIASGFGPCTAGGTTIDNPADIVIGGTGCVGQVTFHADHAVFNPIQKATIHLHRIVEPWAGDNTGAIRLFQRDPDTGIETLLTILAAPPPGDGAGYAINVKPFYRAWINAGATKNLILVLRPAQQDQQPFVFVGPRSTLCENCDSTIKPQFIFDTVAQTSIYKIAGKSVQANYDTYDPTGCIETAVFVIASRGTLYESGRGRINLTLADIALAVYDHCLGYHLVDSVGQTEFTDTEFTITESLSEAHLNVIIPIYDLVTNAIFNIPVHMDWWANGAPILRQTTVNEMAGPEGYVYVTQFTGFAAPATAMGTVTVVPGMNTGGMASVGQNLTPNAWYFGEMDKSTITDFTLSR
jgi:hypothetical protein